MNQHKKLQRRIAIAVAAIVVLALLVGVPLATNDDLRYDLSQQSNLIPGRSAEQLADGDDGALLIVLPLDHGDGTGTSPWLYQAQFIAWQHENGLDIENLETGERVEAPLASVDFTSANGDGSLVLMRGPHADTGEPAAITLTTVSMQIEELANASAVPEESGDWETSIWEKVQGICNRPSPNKRLVGCFTRSDYASYFAGDWQLDVQAWGNYEEVHGLYRGQGLLPSVGFAENDTVSYFQNELGIWRVEVPQSALDAAPAGSPYAPPGATPES